MNPLSGIRYGAEIYAAARAHGLDPRLLAAVAAQETGGPGQRSGRNVVGDGGHGHGLFQIDDRSWAFARTPAAMDPARNANVAAGILADDLRANGGDVRAALSTYNAGKPDRPGTLTTWGDGRTLAYADSVLRHEGALGAAGGMPVARVREGAASAAGATFSPTALATSSTGTPFVALAPTGGTSAVSALDLSGSFASAYAASGTSGSTGSTTTAAPRSWASIGGGGDAQPGALADAGGGDLLDPGDIFDGPAAT